MRMANLRVPQSSSSLSFLLLALLISFLLSLFLALAPCPAASRGEGCTAFPLPLKAAFQLSVPGERRERSGRIQEET